MAGCNLAYWCLGQDTFLERRSFTVYIGDIPEWIPRALALDIYL
jgi:hypothetical protein